MFPFFRSIVTSSYSNPNSSPIDSTASAASASSAAPKTKMSSVSPATYRLCTGNTTDLFVRMRDEVTQEVDDRVEGGEGWSWCCCDFSLACCHLWGSDPCLKVADIFVLRYLILVVLEDIVLRDLTVCGHLGCLMRALPGVGAILEHGINDSTLLILVVISLVVFAEC